MNKFPFNKISKNWLSRTEMLVQMESYSALCN